MPVGRNSVKSDKAALAPPTPIPTKKRVRTRTVKFGAAADRTPKTATRSVVKPNPARRPYWSEIWPVKYAPHNMPANTADASHAVWLLLTPNVHCTGLFRSESTNSSVASASCVAPQRICVRVYVRRGHTHTQIRTHTRTHTHSHTYTHTTVFVCMFRAQALSLFLSLSLIHKHTHTHTQCCTWMPREFHGARCWRAASTPKATSI